MRVVEMIPGLGILCLGALIAQGVGQVVGLNSLLVAIAFGFLLANAMGVPAVFRPGITTHKVWLATGIVLMGASLTLDTLLEAGGVVLVVVILVTGSTIVTVELISRNVFDLGSRLGSLLAAGAGICGVSAIVAVAAAVRARETQIGYAAATILLFDAITIVIYPIIGGVLGLSEIVFGIWAGATMFSTGPIVAVGFTYSETAGQWATITKLSRNALIGVIVLVYAGYYARADGFDTPSGWALWEEFPKFVLGFFALVILASAGAFSPGQVTSIEYAYNWLFLVAFVGLGTEIQMAELRKTGMKPAFIVLIVLVLTSAVSLTVLTLLF